MARKNPFRAAAEVAFDPQSTTSITSRGLDIRAAQEALPEKALNFGNAYAQVEGRAAADVTADMTKNLKTATREFRMGVSEARFAKGKLVDSISGMFHSFGQTLGFDTSKMVRSNIGGKDAEAVEKNAEKLLKSGLNSRATIVERVISKPFRIAADHPRAAMVVGALGAVASVGSIIQRRAERKTQQAAMAQLGQMQQASAPQPAYGLAPGEFEALAAPRMRDSAAGTPVSHSDRYVEAKQAAAAAPQGVEQQTANLAAL